MKTNQECVLEFTDAFNMFKTPYGDYSLDLLKSNPKTSKLRYDLIKEEYTELMDAFNEENFVEIIDALTDILYVTYGAGIALGINLDESFPDAIKRFRRKDFNINQTHFENVGGSYKLDPTTIKKNIFDRDNFSELNSVRVFANTIIRDVELLRKILIDFTDHEKLEEVLNKINYKVYSIGVLLRINLDWSFDIVHKSNMSKVCKDKKTADSTVDWYLENEKRYDSPRCYALKDGRYIVRNESTGKALKSIDYTPADFTEMLNN